MTDTKNVQFQLWSKVLVLLKIPSFLVPSLISVSASSVTAVLTLFKRKNDRDHIVATPEPGWCIRHCLVLLSTDNLRTLKCRVNPNKQFYLQKKKEK